MLRTKTFALRVNQVCATSLKGSYEIEHVGHQLFRCATSVAANFRAACHAKSTADFLNKMKICEEEADESWFWMDFAIAAGYIQESRMTLLLQEAHEITCVVAATCKTARSNSNRKNKS